MSKGVNLGTAGRLGAYGAGLVAVFVAAFAIAAVVVPDRDANSSPRRPRTALTTSEHGTDHDGTDHIAGLSLSEAGYTLSPVDAPQRVDEQGELAFSIADDSGAAVTDFDTNHERDLHLLAVRTDGSNFAHLHPTLNPSTGRWTIPWEWQQAGTYRIYADFTPTGGQQLTLSRTVDVAGELTPSPALEPRTTDSVGGFDVSLSGDLVAGQSSTLTASISRNGEPVTDLEPYLGAFGHLVALRDGDLAYLHVHAEGDEPQPSSSSGPEISFAAQAPSTGRYLLYLDFQVDGTVHTATFVLDAGDSTDAGGNGSTPADPDTGHEHGEATDG